MYITALPKARLIEQIRVLVNSHYSPNICQVLAKSASKGPRYKASKSDTPAKILPYEFVHGQVSPATLSGLYMTN